MSEIHTPIPPIFHSLELGGPFEECLLCQRALRRPGQRYLIERIFRGSEPIIEYAMCDDCHAKTSEEVSEESAEQIQQYFVERWDGANLFDRALHTNMGAPNIDALLDRCLITDASAADCYERQIYAHCSGDSLVLDTRQPVFPMMLSGAIAEGIAEVLSESTKGWMDDFIGDQFGMSPDMLDKPDWSPLLI